MLKNNMSTECSKQSCELNVIEEIVWSEGKEELGGLRRTHYIWRKTE
jgi:hypothetical protein